MAEIKLQIIEGPDAGQESFQRMRAEQKDHQIEREGRDLRSMMDWIETEF